MLIHHNSQQSRQKDLPSLQILRAIAALAVVQAHTGIHYGSWHPMGGFGVDIFFVLSGFIMAMVCVPEGDWFFPKRLTRILPPYWAFTILTYIGLAANPALDVTSPRGLQPLLKSLFFVPYHQLDGSFYPVLGQGWTLNYEMCFYVLVAVSLFLWRRYASWVSILLVLLLMFTARMSAAWGWSVFSSFYGNPIMLEFAAGIVTFHIYKLAKPEVCIKLRPLLWASSVAGLSLLCWYEGVYYSRPGGTRLWLGVYAYLMIQSVVLLSKSGWDIKNRLLVLIGDASYTLYLLHTFVISFLKHVIARNFPSIEIWTPVGTFLALVASTVCAVAVYVLIEKPFHRRLNRWLIPRSDKQTAFRRP